MCSTHLINDSLYAGKGAHVVSLPSHFYPLSSLQQHFMNDHFWLDYCRFYPEDTKLLLLRHYIVWFINENKTLKKCCFFKTHIAPYLFTRPVDWFECGMYFLVLLNLVQFSYNVNIHVNNKKQWRWFIETIYDFIIKFATLKLYEELKSRAFTLACSCELCSEFTSGAIFLPFPLPFIQSTLSHVL